MDGISGNPLFYKIIDAHEDFGNVNYSEDILSGRYRAHLTTKGDNLYSGRYITLQKMSTPETLSGEDRLISLINIEPYII